MDTATTNRVQVQQMLDTMFEQGHLFVGRISREAVGIDGENRGAVATVTPTALILHKTSPETEQQMTVKRLLLEQTDNSIFENPRRVLGAVPRSENEEFSDIICAP